MANSQQQVCDIAMNITTMEEVHEALNDAGDRFAIYIIYPFLMILGIITNGAFCIVLARVPRMRTITNTYLVNLAVADLTFLIVAVSEKLFNNWVSQIPADKTHIGLPGMKQHEIIADRIQAPTINFIVRFLPLNFRCSKGLQMAQNFSTETRVIVKIEEK